MILTYKSDLPNIGDKVKDVKYTVHEPYKENVDFSQLILCSVYFESKAFLVVTVSRNYVKELSKQIKPGEYSVEEYEELSKNKEY